MSAALTKAIKQAKAILAKRAERAAACPSISIQMGGIKIPPLPNTESIYFQIKEAVGMVRVTKGADDDQHGLNYLK